MITGIEIESGKISIFIVISKAGQGSFPTKLDTVNEKRLQITTIYTTSNCAITG